MENQQEVIVEKQMSTKFHRTKHHASRIIEAVLYLGDDLDSSREWKALRGALLKEEKLVDHWKDQQFRRGVEMVCEIVDIGITISLKYDREMKENIDSMITTHAESLLADSTQGKHGQLQSIDSLLNAIEIIAINSTIYNLSSDDINDFRIIFQTIARSQRMVLDLILDERKKQSSQLMCDTL